jgi:RNA recognition motif-containing protein
MSSDEEATAAIEKLNDTELDGRSIKVDYAKPPKNDGFRS